MDLEPLIARVAVLRAQARDADTAARTASKAAQEAQEKYRDADHELAQEIAGRINTLDPVDVG